MSNRPSYREACQIIVDAKVLLRADGTHPTDWREVWDTAISPEPWALYRISEWYEAALYKLQMDRMIEDDKTFIPVLHEQTK